ncbi:hypothetical protein FACS189431_2400 [Alphaproteobacteria bacterium]|nr:hypothetical protein FACS189431_2400 [Alphaproteobacteria bacterium]
MTASASDSRLSAEQKALYQKGIYKFDLDNDCIENGGKAEPDGNMITLIGDSISTGTYSGDEIAAKLPGIDNDSSDGRGFTYAGADGRTGMQIINDITLRNYVVLALGVNGAAADYYQAVQATVNAVWAKNSDTKIILMTVYNSTDNQTVISNFNDKVKDIAQANDGKIGVMDWYAVASGLPDTDWEDPNAKLHPIGDGQIKFADTMYDALAKVWGLGINYQNPGSYNGIEYQSEPTRFIEFWHDTAVAIEILYGIPWEAVMSQAALESGWGTSNFARTKHAFFGVGAVDSNTGNGTPYTSDAMSWFGYAGRVGTYDNSFAEFIHDNSGYRINGAFNHVDDPVGYIDAICAFGYASGCGDGSYQSENKSIINNNIKPLIQSNGWLDSKGVADTYPQARTAAAENARGEHVGEQIDADFISFGNACASGTPGDFLDDDKFIYYNQIDSGLDRNANPYDKIPYNNRSCPGYGCGGCMTFSVTMAVANLLGDKNITPKTVYDEQTTKYFGLQITNAIEYINSSSHGLSATMIDRNEIDSYLGQGAIIVHGVKGSTPPNSAGHVIKGDHYVVIRGKNSDGMYKVADPANSYSFTDLWPESIIKNIPGADGFIVAVKKGA